MSSEIPLGGSHRNASMADLVLSRFNTSRILMT
jgi:hypothetical protein